jgi:pimeloyl-ACP methyl ester carboxylesterase
LLLWHDIVVAALEMQNVLAAMTSRSRSWSMVDRLAFCPPQASYDLDSYPGELILIPREPWTFTGSIDDDRVPCLFLPSLYARFLLIYFHANGEDLGKTHPFLCAMRDIFKVNILAVEYPGYGICPGTPDEAGVMVNAAAAMHFASETLAWPYDGIKLFGRSVGTGPAVALAAQYPVAGLILVTPFLSIREVLRGYLGPIADLGKDIFLNYKLADVIDSPTLIIHGKQDELIPISHAVKLYEKLPGKKMMVCPEKMYHNSALLDNLGMFVRPMTQFFSLPDYTFVNIEMPSWVMPQSLQSFGQVETYAEKLQKDYWNCSDFGYHCDLKPFEAEEQPILLLPSSARSNGPYLTTASQARPQVVIEAPDFAAIRDLQLHSV